MILKLTPEEIQWALNYTIPREWVTNPKYIGIAKLPWQQKDYKVSPRWKKLYKNKKAT